MVTQLAWAYKLSRNQARMLAALYQRRNRMTSRDQMMEALYADDPGAPESANIISCQMRGIRVRFGLDRIVTSYMLGYQLTSEGVAAIEAAMRGEVRPPPPAARIQVNRTRDESGRFSGIAA